MKKLWTIAVSLLLINLLQAQTPQFTLVSSNNQEAIIHVSFPAYQAEGIYENGATMYRLQMQGAYPLLVAGAPELLETATSLIVPATFPLIYTAQSITFWPAFTLILSRICPLLLGPFFAAWALRVGYNYYYRRKDLSASETRGLSVKRSFSASGLSGEAGRTQFELPVKLAQIPFYLWVCSIIVLTAVVTQTTISNIHSQISNILILLVASFFACALQFGIGKLIGYKLPAASKGTDYQDVLINPAAAPKTMAGVSSITAGQAFGQKNTSLGVWMAQTYLDPMASLGAAAYIIWQNLFNSAQLFIVAHKK